MEASLEHELAGGLGGLYARLREKDIVGVWARALEDELQKPENQRDPSFIDRLLPLMDVFAGYFGAEVRHLEKLPATGPVLLVGNHSGGVITPDTSALISAWYRQRGTNDPLVLLAADSVFGIPVFKTICRKLGLIPASHGGADRALAHGASLLLYPGGAHEVFRPYAERNRVEFFGRKGFIKLALRSGVPVVPVVGHGGHETTIVLSRGEGIAKLLGMRRVRLDIFPILLQLPWGVSSPVLPGIPLPSKITLEVCDPIDWSHYGPEAAEDEAIVARCYEEITTRMQATLDRLAAERPSPLAYRLREWWPRLGWRRRA
jgi:1-acyl-sn-glycerol-3-phosphate acyltransferase